MAEAQKGINEKLKVRLLGLQRMRTNELEKEAQKRGLRNAHRYTKDELLQWLAREIEGEIAKAQQGIKEEIRARLLELQYTRTTALEIEAQKRGLHNAHQLKREQLLEWLQRKIEGEIAEAAAPAINQLSHQSTHAPPGYAPLTHTTQAAEPAINQLSTQSPYAQTTFTEVHLEKARDSVEVDFFLCHTKQSTRWPCEDFVRDHLWGYLKRQKQGSKYFRTFYDRVDLPGGEIDKCISVAGKSGVLIVVLDDVAPTDWMQKEMEQAISCGVPIQTIFCDDHFRWEECGKDAWKEKGIAKDLVSNAFLLPTLCYIKKAEFIDKSQENMVNTLTKVMKGRWNR